jgi:glucose-6-phosphate isomerase
MRLTERSAWKALQALSQKERETRTLDLFAADPARAKNFSVEACGLLFDYSKNPMSAEVRRCLLALADECGVADRRAAMFSGGRINVTENRAVLHTALRNRTPSPVMLDGKDIMPDVRATLERIRTFSVQLRHGQTLGVTGRPFRDVVNIGIGGSDLGPLMVSSALRADTSSSLRIHFVSNVDGAHLVATLAGLDPATTLVVVSSKTFTTQETLTNARSAREWLLTGLANSGSPETVIRTHFAAVSTNLEATSAFGIAPERVFGFWDWVGGRYSLWSAIGLPIALAVGFEKFEQLLTGANDMDRHFLTAPPDRNMPMLAALIGVWHVNFLNHLTHAVLPYARDLAWLPAYLQQLEMESNGKRVDREGREIGYASGPVIWGAPGTNGQHAFFQHLHQGTQITPADFIVAANGNHALPDHHEILLANCIAQTEALLRGKTLEEARGELRSRGMGSVEVEALAPHRVFPGNRPSSTIVLPRLDPYSIGALIAFYEHKVFVQGTVWNVNSFDQWGVELGKQLASTVLGELKSGQPASGHDASTARLIEYVLKTRESVKGE